jgi:hypothetical protein
MKNRMDEYMQQQQNMQQAQSTSQSSPKAEKEGDYIDFEEIK